MTTRMQIRSMRALDDQSGFTLVEVMIASLLMLIGVFGIIAAFPKAFSTTVDAGKTMVLNHLAAAKMDELRALGFSHPDLNIGTHGTLVAHSGGDYCYPVTGFSEEYSLRWRVLVGPTDGTSTVVADLKTVIVEATYGQRYTVGEVAIANSTAQQSTFTTFVWNQ